MNNAKQHNRQVRILHMLFSRDWVSAASLATRFEVTERTIYRDIEHLIDDGVPIESVTGPQGGFRLASDQPLKSLTLDGDEAMKMYLVGLLERPVDAAVPSQEVELGTSKLTAMKRLAQRIYFDTADWYWRDESSGLLPSIREGLLTGVALKITTAVTGHSEPVISIVKPYGIVWKAGEWNLVAQPIDGPIQRYRLNLVKHVAPTDLRFSYPETFQLQAWWSQTMEAYGKGDIEVELHVSPTAKDELLRLNLKSNSKVEHTSNGGLILRLYVNNWQWLIPLIASFGNAVVVKSPDALRCAVVRHYQEALCAFGVPAKQVEKSELPKKYTNDDSRLRSTRGRMR